MRLLPGREPYAREALARLAAGAGGRMNHRAIWVLMVIGAEPGLSNREIDERVGSPGKSHVCELLRRLKRLGLIENTQEDPTPYVPNAWRLTSSGRELERAVRHETPDAGEMQDRGDRRPGHIGAGAWSGSVNGVGDAVLPAAFEHALAQAGARAGEAYGAQEGWLDRIRAALLALLELFDEQPALATLLVVDAAQAGPPLQERRRKVLAGLARVLDDERAPVRRYPPPLTAEAVVSGVLGVLHERLLRPRPGPMVELCGSLMSFIVLPFLGAGAARRELARAGSAKALSERKAALELLHGFSGRAIRHPLAPRVLNVIRAEPGLSNVEVARRAGVADEGHMSRVLARLTRLGLIENRLELASLSGSNAWQLTGNGEELQGALQYGLASANGERARADGAVSETATAIAWRAALAGHGELLWSGRAPAGVRERLGRLVAFALLLLPYVRRGIRRALPVAVARSFAQQDKRCQARYSISITDASTNRSTASRTVLSRSTSAYKQGQVVCGARARRGNCALRARLVAPVAGRRHESPSPRHTYSPLAPRLISQGIERSWPSTRRGWPALTIHTADRSFSR